MPSGVAGCDAVGLEKDAVQVALAREAHFEGNGNAGANPPLYPEDLNYKALTDWVEKGIVPADRIDISSPVTPANPTVTTGVMCAYPKMPVHVGGDLRAAGSYACS